ncbi:MAG: NUDIX hydrolase [Azospirillum sp.]|nr:NUDIX hydrolase [Azospirillum sp.]
MAETIRRKVVSIIVEIAGGNPGEIVFLRRSRRERIAGTWTLPGGGVEPGESIVDAAIRELSEETGLAPISDPIPIGFCGRRDFDFDGVRHELDIEYVHCIAAGTPINAEPDAHDAIAIASFEAGPEPLLATIREALEFWSANSARPKP